MSGGDLFPKSIFKQSHTNTHTRARTPPSTQPPTHTSASKELHKSFKDRHVCTRNLVSAVSWCCHLDRKKEGSTASLPPMWSPETGRRARCPQQNCTHLSSAYVLLRMYYGEKSKWVVALNCSEREGCPPVPHIFYVRLRPHETRGQMLPKRRIKHLIKFKFPFLVPLKRWQVSLPSSYF